MLFCDGLVLHTEKSDCMYGCGWNLLLNSLDYIRHWVGIYEGSFEPASMIVPLA